MHHQLRYNYLIDFNVLVIGFNQAKCFSRPHIKRQYSLVVLEQGVQSHLTLVYSLTLSLTDHVTLGKLNNFSMSQIPYIQQGTDDRILVKIKGLRSMLVQF